MGAGLAKLLALERHGRLTFTGYLINTLILISCLGSLAYPVLSHHGSIQFDCIFKKITGLPCPSCGYASAIDCAMHKDLPQSFLHNPGWIMWIALLGLLVFIGVKSLLTGKQALIGRRLLVVCITLILLAWTGKFLIGPQYY